MNVYLPRHINKFFANKHFQQIMSTMSAATNRISTNSVDTSYIKKICQQILSSKSCSQIASTNCVSTNKVDKLYINTFCQQIISTNPDNQFVAQNSQLTTTQKCSCYLRNLSEDKTKDASGIYVSKSESYNTMSNKWVWHYWRTPYNSSSLF